MRRVRTTSREARLSADEHVAGRDPHAPPPGNGALPDDRAAHHDWLVSLVAVPRGGVVADLGCGTGADLERLAARCTDENVRFIGVDHTEESEAAVRDLSRRDRRISFQRERLRTSLPFADASVDVVFSHNLLECLADPRGFSVESARVLRPGGQVVVGHWDWDSQVFDGPDKALVRRLIAAYADWQQGWMEHADGWMGRRLWGTFNGTGDYDGEALARVLINTTFSAPWFGYENASALRSLVTRGLISSNDYEQFAAAQLALQAEGRYFYGITGYAYVGVRRPT